MLCNATGDPGCTNIEGWLSDATLYDWHGVNTDVDGKVTEIRNPGNNLAGDLEAELSNLDNLTWLALRQPVDRVHTRRTAGRAGQRPAPTPPAGLLRDLSRKLRETAK